MKISIITVVLNNRTCIKDSIQSVLGQSHPDVEYIVVDGGSTDGTTDVIKAYGGFIAKWISEPDHGIYDAMNKGIRLATGDVVGILNSDDSYAHKDVLSAVATVFRDGSTDVCYGDLLYVDKGDPERVVRYWKAGNYSKKKFFWGWMPPHPTFFVRRQCYEAYGMFHPALGTGADYELILRFMLRHNRKAVYLPHVMVKMRSGGISNASIFNRLKANHHDREAWRLNNLKPYPWTIVMKPLSKLHQFLIINGGSKVATSPMYLRGRESPF